MEVPKFQRSYSWDRNNVKEYLADLEAARLRNASYFMGTVVFALPSDEGGRRRIVDGQQRLATTAILLVAIRDQLKKHGKLRQADQLDARYLRGYDLAAEDDVERLILSPQDQDAYDALLHENSDDLSDQPLKACYELCREALEALAPTPSKYKKLLDVVGQLEKQVQVLVAVASDLPEAYVIFETLNDRGADLTTADLLKNFLFSKAGAHSRYVEESWISLESAFDKPEELVKFIRYEYASRNGFVHVRGLYRAIQREVSTSTQAKGYIQRLTKAQVIYSALKDTAAPYWGTPANDVQDAILAYRRLGFESSFPVVMAAFAKWDKAKATKLFVKLAKWSVRGLVAGRIGAGQSEDAFGSAAKAIFDGGCRNQTQVRDKISKLIPNDAEFEVAFQAYGQLSVARAKYMLAMLERAYEESNNIPPKPFEWHSTGVTIEHVMAQSAVGANEERVAHLNNIGNLALLEKKLNKDAGNKAFNTKKHIYRTSEFGLTQELYACPAWEVPEIQNRTAELARLACKAWPTR